MGGHKRKGQSQRTKNNMKPSNSGRIAELVDNRGFQFSSFSTLSDSHSASGSSHLPNVPVLSFEMFGSDVDPNFNVVLKKINKKDATTRFKALQELKDLCKSSTPEVLNQVLPVWARIYCLLAVDVEHRVREAVQEVHQLIVNKVGRNLAPYLKQIVPLWFISQYDTYAPAASVASIAFQEVFSSRKMIEVISFCQAEILGYIKENILNLTTQSLSKGDLNKDEMEAKYERIIISSLNGYALYLSKVPSEQIEKFKTINLEIISSTKFWKFSKFKTPSVRYAWFTLLSSLCQYGVFLLVNEKKQVANSVIGGIDDNDSGVLSVVWEAALHSFAGIQDFWLYVNLEKFFLPKFCNILKHGGKGNANFIYPNILLLLNSIPADVIKEKHQFFDMIFSSFQEGMKLPIVFQSPTGSDAVASSFIECIQFLIKLNIQDEAFCLFLIEQHVSKVLSVYMLQAFCHYQLKSFVRSSSHMLMYWHKNKDSQKIYGVLLQKFWTNILSLSIDNFKNSTLDKDQLLVVLNTHFLIISIFNSPNMLFKKNLKVSFLDDSNELITDSCNVKDTSYSKSSSERKLEEDMLLFVKELFECYYTFCLKAENKILQILVLSQMNKIIELLNVRLSSWIQCLQPRWGSSLLMWLKDTDILMEHLLGIMFSSLEFLDVNEQSQLLLELTKERSKECLQDALKLASHSENAKLKQWLHSEDMKIEICRTYDEISNDNNEAILETVKHFLDLNSNGEFIIGISTVLWLIDKIERQLSSHSESDLKKGTEMVSTLFSNIASAKQTRYEDLVLRMLESLFIGIIQGYGKIVYKTWEKGMKLIAASNVDDSSLKEHIKKLSVKLTTYISDRETQFDIKLIHHSVINFVVILTKNSSRKMSDFGVMFIEMLLSSVWSSYLKELQKQIETICSYGDIINGKLHSDMYLEDNELNLIKEKWNPLLEINILAYGRSIEFVLKILSSVFGVEAGEEENEDDTDKLLSFPSIPCEVQNIFTKYIVHLAYGLSLLKKFKTYYSSTMQYFDIKNLIEPCGRLLKEIVQRCDQSQQRKILKTFISNNQSPSNALWCDAKELILDYLEGTLQDGTISALSLHNDDTEIPGLDLEINEIHKLRRLVESNSLSNFVLNEKLNIIVEKYKETFLALNNTSFMGIAKDFLLMTAEMAWLLNIIIATYPTVISVTAWDFARISVTKWLSCISNTPYHSDNYNKFVMVTIATCELLKTISSSLSKEESLGKYCEEWREVFAADAYYFLCKSWKNITETALKQGVNYKIYLHVVQLSETISCLCDMKTFHKLKPINGNIKEWVEFTMTCILTPSVPVQITSYKILQVLLPNLMKMDEELNETSLHKISCNMLETKLIETQTVFNTMLQDFSIGVSCSVAPFTDSYTYSLAYLLLWSVLIKMCKEGDAQQKYIYPLWIKERGIIPNFIEGVVKLMPESVIYFQEKNIVKGRDFFAVPPSHTFYDWTSEKLSHLSCWLMTELMATLPAVVRQWASEAEPKQLAFVDRLVTAFISPTLALREMFAINKQQKTFDNMKVYTHPSVREVVAVYTVEESSTELVVQLANNHPLSPPKVDISKAMISSMQTRQWLKQLTIFLTHQNGSIWDGLVLWKSNLDKKFEGIDECYICFSILHNTTHQLPKLSCHTCKKKFHSYCLYKWFSTSHKSTCPICRAIF